MSTVIDEINIILLIIVFPNTDENKTFEFIFAFIILYYSSMFPLSSL